jgi:cephalosporin hydroxylase
VSQLAPLPNWDSAASLATFHTGLYRGVIQGREMQKCADDLDRYQQILNETDPDVIVEIGTRYGGSAVWFHTQSNAKVITVDITMDQMTPEQFHALSRRGVTAICGHSTDPHTIAQVRQAIADSGGRTVMVSLDGDHHSPTVWAEIQAYGAMVTSGQYLVAEDACFDLWEGEDSRRGGRSIPEVGGTLKALQLAGMVQHPWWVRDTGVEGRTSISHSPCGWWVRA